MKIVPMRIGQLAARAGVTTDTIRYYEQIGLLPRPQRSAAGYRQYPESAIQRLRTIRNAMAFGFSLKEVSGFFKVREGGGTPCRDVRAAAARILAAVDLQIEELSTARKRMAETLLTWDDRLANTPAGSPAHLLADLDAPKATPVIHARFPLKPRAGNTVKARH
ncbi:MAG: heavy metal-responsive transcriptional regulator [Nitrospirota bacterium]